MYFLQFQSQNFVSKCLALVLRCGFNYIFNFHVHEQLMLTYPFLKMYHLFPSFCWHLSFPENVGCSLSCLICEMDATLDQAFFDTFMVAGVVGHYRFVEFWLEKSLSFLGR